MKIRRATSTVAAIAIGGACFTHTACDSGSEVAVGDWRSFEQRLAKLEEENDALRAELADALTVEDLAGYATVDQCGSCVQPGDIADFITLAEVPPPDLSGLATTGSVEALEDALALLVDADAMSAYVTNALEGYVTKQELEDNYYDEGESDARFLTEAKGDLRYVSDDELRPYLDGDELAAALLPYITGAAVDQKLVPYITEAEVDTKLTPYITEAEVDTKIDPLITQAELNTAIEPFLTQADLPDFTKFALVSQLPNMSLYALKTDLLPYAKTADLSIYALKSELSLYALRSEVVITDLSAYALKTDLPNLAPYALKSELPNLANYALKSDLDAYALDTDLAAFDGAIRLIDESIDLDIPGDFPTIQAAMTWLDGYSIAQGVSVTFHLADGVYPFPATGWAPTHRDGGRLAIIGNTTTPGAVVLSFPNGGGITVNRGRLGFLDGVTIRGARGGTNAGGHGVQATQGGVIQLGSEVIVEDFTGQGVRAVLNGVVLASSVISQRNAQGFAALDGGAIFATGAVADDNFGHGFQASIGGIIEASSITSTDNRGRGIHAYGGGTFYSATSPTVPPALLTGNYSDGVLAAFASNVHVPGATITGNGAHPDYSGNGVGAFNGASVDAYAANASGNDGQGFTTWLGGMISADDSKANGNLRGDGYFAGGLSGIDAQGSEAITNHGNGYQATHGGNINAGAAYDYSTNPATVTKRSSAEGNLQAGFRSMIGGVIEARDSEATDNHEDGYHAWMGATLIAERSSSSENHQNGYGSYANSAINAPGSSATDNSFSGFHAGLGGVIEASVMNDTGTRAVAEGNLGSGFDAWGNGAINANGALSTKNQHGFSSNSGGLVSAGRWTRMDGNTVVYDYVAEALENSWWGFGASNGAIIEANEARSTKNGWDGFWARTGSVIEASWAQANENGRDGFTVEGGSSLNAIASAANKNGTSGYGNGYRATNGAVINANSDYQSGAHTVADDNNGAGFEAWGGSTIAANAAESTNNSNDGFHAYLGSSINAGQATNANGQVRKTAIAKGNQRHGFAADNGSALDTHGALAELNGDAGFTAFNGSSIDANAACVGPQCEDTVVTQAVNNGRDGFRADHGSALAANQASVMSDASHGAGRAFSASQNSTIDAVNTVVNGYGDGFYAWLGGAIQADSSNVSDIRGWVDGGGHFNGSAFTAHHGATIHAPRSTVRAVPLGTAFQAHMSSIITADDSNLNQGAEGGTALQGYSAHGHSLIHASNAHASHVTQSCFTADMGSTLFADASTATDCDRQGYAVSQNSVANLNGAVASQIGDQGFYAGNGSVITGQNLVANQCGQNDDGYRHPAFQVQAMSYMGTRDVQATSNGGDAFRIESGSYFESYSECFDASNGALCQGNVRNTITNNNGWALNVYDNSFARMPGVAASNNLYGVAAGTMSGLDINQAQISDVSIGMAVQANGMCWLNADRTVTEDAQGGMSCGGGSYCSARDASVATVNDGGSTECDINGSCQCVGSNFDNCPEFGFNAHSGALFDINGATLGGSNDLPYAPSRTNNDGTRLLSYDAP